MVDPIYFRNATFCDSLLRHLYNVIIRQTDSCESRYYEINSLKGVYKNKERDLVQTFFTDIGTRINQVYNIDNFNQYFSPPMSGLQ